MFILDTSSPKRSAASSSDPAFTESWTHQPDGRLRVCTEGRKLLTGEEDMYIPMTQEPAPMTEDVLDEHAEILTRSIEWHRGFASHLLITLGLVL